MDRVNQRIREYAQERGVHLWEIADRIGINDGNFSRKLRRELADDETAKILAIIDQITKERN